MLAGDGCCAQGDCDGEEARADEEHHGKVEVVHAAEEHRARRGLHTAARAKGELRNKSCQPHKQAPNQSPEGALPGESVSASSVQVLPPSSAATHRLTFSLTRGTKSASTKTADTGGAR